jgi:peptide deformylase
MMYQSRKIGIINIIITLFLAFLPINISCGGFNKMKSLQELQDLKLKIVQVGDPVLRIIPKPLTKEEILTPAIQDLIESMKRTMRDAPGVGLAAPQVGIPLQIIMLEDREEYIKFLKPEEIKERDRHPVPSHVIVNPKITLLEPEKKAEFYEGCLSIQGFVGRVPRALKVKVDALNEKSEPITIEAHGWYARILQHEIDHLQGTLYIDHMHTRTFTSIENYKRFQA